MKFIVIFKIILHNSSFAKNNNYRPQKPKGWNYWWTLRLIGSSCWVFETCHDYFDHVIETFMFVQMKIAWIKTI